MNLLKKQGILNSVILYAGTALGFFNLIILFQRYLSIEQIGFFSLLATISMLYAQFASLGINNIILKYFPVFKTNDKKHGGFISFVCLYVLVSFVVFTLLYVLLKMPIIEFYKGKQGSYLLLDNYYFLIPLSFFILAFGVLESLARAIFHNVLSAFLREVLLRVFTSIAVLLIVANLINYHQFILIYIIANAIIAIILSISIYTNKNFRIAPIDIKVQTNKSEIARFGLFAVLSGGSFALIQNIDTLMLSALTKESFSNVGIYSTFFGIAMVISLPAKALSRTSYQIISNAWAENDLQKIGKIYRKTSTVQLMGGCLLLVGLIINKEHLIALLHKSEYRQFFNVFILIGFAFLADITGGINGAIINSSKYYKLVTILLTLAVVLCILLNLILIPLFGMMGAALSYFLTTLTINFIYWLFIKVKFKLQPFGKIHYIILLIACLSFVIGYYLPVLPNFYFDLIYRSTIVTIFYSSACYFLKLSEDMNEMVDSLLLSVRK